MTTDLPDAAKPDHLTDALRRHGVLSAGRVREVTADAPRDTLLSRIVRLKLAYEGPAGKAAPSLRRYRRARSLAALLRPTIPSPSRQGRAGKMPASKIP